MRALLIPVLGFTVMAANDETQVEPSVPGNSPLVQEYQEARAVLKNREALAKLGKTVEGPVALRTARSVCRDRLERVQDAEEGLETSTPDPLANLRLFRRQPNTPETPLAIYAVDRRENGCGVMVMMGDINDVRPVPMTNPSDYRVMPAEDDDR